MKLTRIQLENRDAVISKTKSGIYRLTSLPCLCGESKSDVIIANRDRYGIPIQIVLCMSCGLMRSDPYYDDATLASFYAKEYRPLYVDRNKSTADFFSEQITFGRHIKNFLEKEVLKEEIQNKLIFEIGCGAGGILQAFNENGNKIAGCDYGIEYVEFGKQKGLRLLPGGAETLKSIGKADIIILNHTLEHMRNPQKELLTIQELLAPEGILYIALPGIFFIHDTYKGNLSEYLQNAHSWYFTKKTLGRLLSDSGFEMIAGNEMIMSTYRVGRATKLAEKETSKKVYSYINHIKRFGWYYRLKNFSIRHTAFETLRNTGPLYRLLRTIYRKWKNRI